MLGSNLVLQRFPFKNFVQCLFQGLSLYIDIDRVPLQFFQIKYKFQLSLPLQLLEGFNHTHIVGIQLKKRRLWPDFRLEPGKAQKHHQTNQFHFNG